MFIHDYFLGLYINEDYTGTQLQHVLLGILNVREKQLKESVAKAIGYSWKVHVHCLPIPVDGRKSKKANKTLLFEKTVSFYLK